MFPKVLCLFLKRSRLSFLKHLLNLYLIFILIYIYLSFECLFIVKRFKNQSDFGSLNIYSSSSVKHILFNLYIETQWNIFNKFAE